MVNVTSKWGLPLLVDTDVIDPIQTPLNLHMTETDRAITQAYNAGIPLVGSAAERDALFPGTPAQGVRVYRSDLGRNEAYYGLYSVQNPGGRASAGWGSVGRASTAVSLTPGGVALVVNDGNYYDLVNITFSTSSPGRVDMVGTTLFQATGNAAGVMRVLLNGVECGVPLRVGNLNQGYAPIAFTKFAKGISINGTNTLKLQGTAEPGGLSWYGNNPQMEVWNE